MRILIALSAILFTPLFLYAQDRYSGFAGPHIDDEILKISASILVLYLIITFVLAIMKSIFDFRLKSKLVDKGVSDKMAEQVLQPQKKDAKNQTIKSFLILFAVGAGLIIINYTLPLGFHSIAIMALSVSLGFLAYFYYLKQTGN